MENHVYACFGLHIQSQIPLPEMEDSTEPDNTLSKVVVRLRDVAESGESAEGAHVVFSERGASLSVGGVAHYHIANGREIEVTPEPGASMRNVRVFLLGTAFGILCHQRGLIPLHANALIVEGEAVAFAGPRGAGKSTLAAYFQSRGHQLLCDDICAVSFDERGRPLAWPGPPRLKLWRDAVAAFGHDSQRLERVVDRQDKFHLPFSRDIGHAPFPLRRLYVLRAHDTESGASVSRLRGASAIEAIAAQTYRGRFIADMGLRTRHLRMSAALASHAEIYVASRKWGFGAFDRDADRLLRHAQARRSGAEALSEMS
jgi:hypothetical protein